MAIFPQGKTKVLGRANGGEKRVLEALARHLEDDYTVWHNIPIMGSGREPDFVILHPLRGLLILEVKDWKRETIADANPMQVQLRTPTGIVNTEHPLSQARGYVLDLIHLLQKVPALLQPEGKHQGKLLLPWGWGAVLSRIRKSETADDPSFVGVFEAHKVMLWDDLQEDVDSLAFQEKLWGMFNVQWQRLLTLPQMNIVRGLLFPELRVGIQQALPLEGTPSRLLVQDVLQVMDLNQEAVARGLGEGHRVVHGPAGSGKTMILVFRAAQLAAAARPEKPILVLCYNRDLAHRIDTLLRLKGVGPAVQVSTFHKWAMDLIRTYQLAPIPRQLRSDDYDALARIACESIASARIPKGQYTALLIDEAHDLADEWLAAATQMVDPATRSLLVLYDDAQSIYQQKRRKLQFSRLGIEAKGRTTVLRINYRNTTEVLALAMECAGDVLAERPDGAEEDIPLVLPQSAGRSGPLPMFLSVDGREQEAELVVGDIADQIAHGRSPADIAVLARYWNNLEPVRAALARARIPTSPRKEERRRDGPAAPEVTLTTFHSSKGLEFPSVYIVAIDQLKADERERLEEVRLLYVGMTRATHRLHLSAVGGSPFAAHVQQALERVKRAYQ